MRGIFLVLSFSVIAFAPRVFGQDLTTKSSKNYRRSQYTRDESFRKADKRKIALARGEDVAIDIDFEIGDDQKQVSVTNREVVIPQVVRVGEKTQIVFKPLKAGETSVTVRDNAGDLKIVFTVQVNDSDLLRVAGEVREMLKDIEGLEIRVVGPKVLVEGDLLTPDDFGMVQRVITSDERYTKVVVDKTRLSPMALTVLSRKIQEEVNAFAPNVRTRVVNGTIFLEGTVDSDGVARRVETVATYYLPEVRPNSILEKSDNAIAKIQRRSLIYNALLISAPPPKKNAKMVRVRFDFVELNKDYTRIFGFKWAPGFSGTDSMTFGTDPSTGQLAASGATFSGIISSLLPKLNWLTRAGYARVLRTVNVVVKSGQPAEVKDTRQFNFTVQGSNGVANNQSVSAGLEAAVTPQIVGQSEDIDMDIKFTQSSPVGSVVAGSAPSIAAHTTNTKVYVKSAESAAISGLEINQANTSFNGDDSGSTNAQGQSTQPIVNLIHSKNFEKKKAQFVIFVTPQILENASDGTEDLKRNYRIKVK